MVGRLQEARGCTPKDNININNNIISDYVYDGDGHSSFKQHIFIIYVNSWHLVVVIYEFQFR